MSVQLLCSRIMKEEGEIITEFYKSQNERSLLRVKKASKNEGMSVFLTTLAVVVTLYLLTYYYVFKCSRRSQSCVKLKGKTAIVTGSNTGIGKATALELARRGARVILACRNKQKAEAAVYDIRRESGNNEVLYMQLDLASQKSVRSFAEAFLKTEPRLDLLINNAGVFGPGRTEEGLDLAFGVNHLGHFLLTVLLLERLKMAEGSRVVTVAALLHRFGTLDFPALCARQESDPPQSSWAHIQSYCNSKLCNVLFTRELANQLVGTGVTCYCLHPGVIYTELCRSAPLWLRLLLLPVGKLLLQDVESGSQTTLHCALQEGLECYSGRYFSDCSVREVSAKARDDAVARKLWEVSETLCALS
ncbi:hypothetical protein GJAV_G00061210 [Gymnothorax javanicus]|nr:hypothetical protein GJAV_G00061210 [Gymnothorax javanicus]